MGREEQVRGSWWRWLLLVASAMAIGPAVDECAATKETIPCGLFASLYLLAAVAAVAALAATDISWGYPAMPFQMTCLTGALVAIDVVTGVLSTATEEMPGLFGALAMLALMPLFVLGVFCTLNMRGWPFVLLAVLFCVRAVPTRCFNSHTVSTPLNSVLVAASGFTRHVLDQRRVLFVAILVGGLATEAIPNLRKGNPSQLIIVLVVLWSLTILLDTKTVLPDTLKQTKFIKLSYLRGMRRSGARIRRLQEMPDEAFGDPAKAKYLVITSHRWLDRFACDVLDAEHPNGVRLASMVRRIGAAFPETISEAITGSQSWWHCCKALLRSVLASGDDVLIFFDFMGLPQIGKNSDGDKIPRTAEEEALFFCALPAMGSLYEMHPVVVIPEVNAGTSSYFGSGWCYSEFCTAFLSGTLTAFSSGSDQAYEAWHETTQAEGSSLTPQLLREATSGPMSDQLAKEVLRALLADLHFKRFFNNADMAIVRGIVVANMTKRQLVDATVAQDISAVRECLHDMDREDVLHVLDFPVDPFNYDRLLHKAVRLGSEDIVRLLLEYGADPRMKNYWGDLPWQQYRVPRCSAAARLCRQWVPAPLPAYDALQTVVM